MGSNQAMQIWLNPVKNNSDISLEFYSFYDLEPRILIFDATFSNNPIIHKQKSYYKETIRYRPSIDAKDLIELGAKSILTPEEAFVYFSKVG